MFLTHLEINCTAHVSPAHGRNRAEWEIIFPCYEFASQLMLPRLLKIFKDTVAAEDVIIRILAVPWNRALNHVPCEAVQEFHLNCLDFKDYVRGAGSTFAGP